MKAGGRVAHSDEFLDIVMPERDGYAVMLRAYFDESERSGGIFAVAGFAFRKAQAKRCAHEWTRLFEQYGGCHMTDLQAREQQFKGISDDEAARLIREAVVIIHNRADYGIAVSCDVREMNAILPKWVQGFEGAYPVCCHMAMTLLGQLVRDNEPNERIAYVFEDGHRHEGAARRFMANAMEVPQLKESYQHFSDSFASKKDVIPLQTADVFAWEFAKCWDETIQQHKRKMRKSLIAILTQGKPGVSDFDSKRFKFSHLTGLPLRGFIKQVEQLGLLQLAEDALRRTR
jgi:hypothetical protein